MLKIKTQMGVKGITQEQLAEIIGTNRVVVGCYVRGVYKPSQERAEAIARALDWPTDQAAELFAEITEVG